MLAHPNLSPVATLIGDPTRSALLAQLFDGAARTAGELACGAGVSPQVASNHLAKLLAGGLLALEVQGRHRYYRLARPEVAQALEALAGLGMPEPANTPRRVELKVPPELRFARTCYDHLAGELGVAMSRALLQRGYLLEEDARFETTPEGEAWLAGFGVPITELRRSRRTFARRCLDWSERRPHLGGALGTAVLKRLLDLGWVVRIPGNRAVRLTVAGSLALERELDLVMSARDLAS